MSKDDETNLQRYKEDMIGSLIGEIFAIVQDEANAHGKDFADEIVISMIGSMIATLVYSSLAYPRLPAASNPHDAHTRQQIQTEQSYSAIKSQLIECIATGFAGGFLNFDPRQAYDFAVSITPVGEPVNKLPA